jgi:excinuclease ABC subunit C
MLGAVRRLEAEMHQAAGELQFEKAARLRDRLASVRKAIEKQQMVTERTLDLDCFGLVEDELEAAIQVFYVRRGRVVGRKGFIVDKVEDLTEAQLVAQVLEQHYADAPLGVPPLVLVPEMPEDPETVGAWLAVLRSAGAGRESAVADVEWWAATQRYRVERSVNPAAGAGGRVEVRVPQRGENKALLDTVVKNANEEFMHHRLKRAADHNARAKALNALQDALGLPESPLRIECYDMSHLQGTDYVGSMVVMEDGLARPQEYRRFKVKTVEGNDDFAAMEEVLTRRLTAYLVERDKPVEERRRRFSYPPQLLLVDGGKGQLGVAVRVVERLGLASEIPVAALAKQFEEVYVPGRSDPIRIPRTSDALYLLQQIRDEAHRFAITYHRKLRDRRMTASILDGIPGLGPSRKKRLTRELGGTKAVKEASLETLKDLSWLPDAVAEALYQQLHG